MSKVGGHNDVDRVREATDLLRLIGESIPLRPRGREHIGLCPFHDDKTPSMAVVTHKGNAFYKCHACGAGGDCFDFVMQYHRMDFPEALRLLAQKAGITLTPWKRDAAEAAGPKPMDVKKANAFAAAHFRRTLNDERLGAAAREIIATRGISPEMVDAFMLGAAADAWDGLLNRIRRQSLPVEPFVSAGLLKLRKESEGQYDAFRNRVMFPICDELGSPIAFGARKINPEDEPKYLNSSESALFNKSKTLYGLHLAKRAIIEKHAAIITEGYTDVIACHQAGVTNAVATLGTALTPQHARILGKLCNTVILLFDGDEAGMKAADRALQVFFAEDVDIKICVLPDGLDPDELIKQDGGRARFDAALEAAADALQYKIERFRSTLAASGDSSLSGRQKRLEGFLQELAQVGFASLQGVRKQLILTRLAELMRLPVGAIEQALAKFTAAARKPAVAATAPEADDASTSQHDEDETIISRTRRLAEFDLLGVVVFEPALSLRVLDEIAVDMGGARGALSIERFQHPASRAVAAFVAQRAEAASSFTVQQLLGAIEDQQHRTIASRLYFDGQRLAGEDASNLEPAVRSAWEALERCGRHEQLQEVVDGEAGAAGDPLERAREIVNSRRQAGRIAFAIGRGVRT
ncbi:MAG TPA: DNA primase [Phycisphaerales bacterium]|nr:DNA primase [Phycisphaerales bacterium]